MKNKYTHIKKQKFPKISASNSMKKKFSFTAGFAGDKTAN